MERLTKRDEHGNVVKVKSSRDTYICTILEEETKFDAEILNRLAEYEDAEEAGLFKRLPCKVGDWIYVIYHCKWHCQQAAYFIYDKQGLFIKTVGGGNFEFVWGENAFATKPEAEAKLAELKEKTK